MKINPLGVYAFKEKLFENGAVQVYVIRRLLGIAAV